MAPDAGAPMRWLVVGSGDAGKSTLARRMGVILDLPDIPEGCPDRILDWDFLRWVTMFRRASLPRVMARLAEAPHVPVHHLRSRRNMADFLEALRAT